MTVDGREITCVLTGKYKLLGSEGMRKGGRVGREGILNGRMVGKFGSRRDGMVGNLKGAWVGEYTFTRTLGTSAAGAAAGLLAAARAKRQADKTMVEADEDILR